MDTLSPLLVEVFEIADGSIHNKMIYNMICTILKDSTRTSQKRRATRVC